MDFEPEKDGLEQTLFKAVIRNATCSIRFQGRLFLDCSSLNSAFKHNCCNEDIFDIESNVQEDKFISISNIGTWIK